nr:2-methoxy-6-polyprenyl-1,4-benzoquinol methylase, mitochondrial-like isoform X2 [Nerophis lumbriciformis]
MAVNLRRLVRRVVLLSAADCCVPAAAFSRLSGRCWTPPSCRRFSQETGEKNTHFGFETVPEEEKAKKVYEVFENVAQKYDVMNDAMSLGIHRLWKDALLHAMHPQPGTRLLDVAGGTGDIAFRFLDYVQSQKERQARRLEAECRAVVCDINKEMLKVGKEKADNMGVSAGLSWVVGDAEELPFDDNQFDIYTVAFGIRNVTHIEKALQEALRVLKPGGRFMCLEFSKVTNPVLAKLYDAYSFQVIPVLGEVIAGDWKSYQYLVESIRKFPAQDEFKEMMEDAGFFCVQYHNLTAGVVSLHSGFKL